MGHESRMYWFTMTFGNIDAHNEQQQQQRNRFLYSPWCWLGKGISVSQILLQKQAVTTILTEAKVTGKRMCRWPRTMKQSLWKAGPQNINQRIQPKMIYTMQIGGLLIRRRLHWKERMQQRGTCLNSLWWEQNGINIQRHIKARIGICHERKQKLHL
jgi:hypothetical protein